MELWKLVVGDSVFQAFIALRGNDRKKALQAFDPLRNNPTREADFTTADSTGRTLSIAALKPFQIAKQSVGFEFEPRAKKGTGLAKEKTPAPKVDLTNLEEVAKCLLCGSRVLDAGDNYLCEKTQAEKKKCKFKVGKVILQQPIDR